MFEIRYFGEIFSPGFGAGYALPAFLNTVLRVTLGGLVRLPALDIAARNAGVHDLADGAGLPLCRDVGVAQCLRIELLGTHPVTCVVLQKGVEEFTMTATYKKALLASAILLALSGADVFAEALGNTNIPAEWETRAICEIMNTGISRGDIQGWQAHKTAKRYPKYGVQKGWERVTSPETGAENFSEITDAEAQQLGFPF